jgi:lysophospholipase L1-like esterase
MVRRLVTRGALAGVFLLLVEALYAVFRPSPDLEEFDPSGDFGDPSLPSLRVAVLGDSTVTAPGVSDPDEIWVRLVCRRLSDTFHVELKSFASGGSMAHDLVRDQMQPALDFDPDLIFVSVGGNDLIKGVSKRGFEDDLNILIAGLSESGAIIVQSGLGDLGTIPRLVPPLRNLISTRSEMFDQIHRAVGARYGTHIVEQRSDSREAWFEDRTLWADDLFHVSARGHERWASVIWPTIESSLSELHGAS